MMSPVKAVEVENKRLKWSKPDELAVPEVPNHTWIMDLCRINLRMADLRHGNACDPCLRTNQTLLIIRPIPLLLNLIARHRVRQNVQYQWWTLTSHPQKRQRGRLDSYVSSCVVFFDSYNTKERRTSVLWRSASGGGLCRHFQPFCAQDVIVAALFLRVHERAQFTDQIGAIREQAKYHSTDHRLVMTALSGEVDSTARMVSALLTAENYP